MLLIIKNNFNQKILLNFKFLVRRSVGKDDQLFNLYEKLSLKQVLMLEKTQHILLRTEKSMFSNRRKVVEKPANSARKQKLVLFALKVYKS